jgi:superfamily I DNA and/or RNA helicase/serine/threonine protein kinase
LDYPKLINDRYAIQPPAKAGGMAEVYKAYDIDARRHVAIKLFSKGIIEDDILKETFEREVRALKELRHVNIVELLDEGIEKTTGSQFLVLEWMDSDLWALKGAAALQGWDSFYTEIGRPLLKALAFAHSRQVVHRDVKPKNILLDSSGMPKLADFGISKLKTWLEPGITLNEFASRPFCPPEPNDGSFEYSRDVFGFAAVTVQCLSEGPLHTYDELFAALDDLDVPQEVFAALQQALSRNPASRHANAAVLLSELDVIQAPRETAWIRRDDIYFELSGKAFEKLTKEMFGTGKDEISALIAADLNAVCCVGPYQSNVPNSTEQFSFYGGSFSLHVAIHRTDPGQLVVLSAAKLSPALSEQRREKALVFPINARFGKPEDQAAAQAGILNLRESLEKHLAILRVNEAEAKEQELFRIWSSVLKVKTDLERQKEQPLKFRRAWIEDNRVRFVLSQPAGDDLLGQQRRVNERQSCLVSGEVEQVEGTTLTLYADRITVEQMPSSGELIIDNWAAREAISRQKQALDAIRFDRAVRGDLRHLLVHPEKCKSQTPAHALEFFDKQLDTPKQNAIASALGSEDFLVVQGPPGTGKTTFITELVLQTLRRDPKARILLTSQTHVALDNAVDKLQKCGTAYRIVRIGRSDNVRISKDVEKLLLDNQMESWRDAVLQRGRQYLERWANDHNISRTQFEVSNLLRQLSVLDARISELQTLSSELSKEVGELKTASTTATGEEVEGFDDLNQREDELERVRADLAKLEKERKKIAAAVKKIEPDAAEILDSDPAELTAWADTYLPDSPDARRFTELIATHVDWESRFGRINDFEAALIASSQVVAGTCVGVAAVRGLSDLEFDLCIVDEASKATPTETLVPLSRARRWVLVGDSNQLPPFLEDGLRDRTMLEANGLDEGTLYATLFSRLQQLLPPECQTSLSMQHRMVPEIGDLISECFYRGELSSAPKTWDRTFQPLLPRPVTWLTTASLINRIEVSSGLSFNNPCEAKIVHDLLVRMNVLAESKKSKWNVLVITGYSEQKNALIRTLASAGPQLSALHIECNTVDAVQGREADVAIYSVTRSNAIGRLGFLRELRRLNVALSRGRQYLVLVGDHHFCRMATGENPFRRIVEYIEQNPAKCAIKEFKN